jgi:uncharacterized protein YidB (DUF937 family)
MDLSKLAQTALGALGGGQGGASSNLMQLAAGFLQQQGGIDGLLQKFNAAGLGDVAKSWVAKGPNLPVSGDQIAKVFGDGPIQGLAQQVGLQPSQVSGGLAQLLPGLVDQLTPDGQSVGGDALQKGLASLLGGGGKGLFG